MSLRVADLMDDDALFTLVLIALSYPIYFFAVAGMDVRFRKQPQR